MSEQSLAVAPGAERGAARWTGLACDFAGVLLLVMAVLICVEIAVRGIANRSTLVSDEYSGYLFVWITMIGMAHALRTGSFLHVEQLVQHFGPLGQALTAMFSALVGVAVSAVCTWASGTLVLASWRLGTVSIQPSATPLWLPEIILPVGFAALVVLYAAVFVDGWRALRARKD